GEAKTGFGVVGLLVDGERVYSSDSLNHVRVAERAPDGLYKWVEPIEVKQPAKGAAHPAGLARQSDSEIWTVTTRGNDIQLLDVKNRKVLQRVAVGVAPFAVVPARPDKLYVSNWGGDPPKEGEPKGVTSGTDVRVDPRTNVAIHGSVSVVTKNG